MLAEVGQIREASSNTEVLVDSGAAWPCAAVRNETWSITRRGRS